MAPDERRDGAQHASGGRAVIGGGVDAAGWP